MVKKINSSQQDRQPADPATWFPQTHTLPLQERLKAGRALRESCPRKSQAVWMPPSNRPDPVDLLIENSQGRLEDLVPIRLWTHGCQPVCLLPGRGGDYGLRSFSDNFHRFVYRNMRRLSLSEFFMRNIREQGHSILLVEQNFKLGMTVADFVYIISTGRIVYQGLPPELEKQKEILNRHLGI